MLKNENENIFWIFCTVSFTFASIVVFLDGYYMLGSMATLATIGSLSIIFIPNK